MDDSTLTYDKLIECWEALKDLPVRVMRIWASPLSIIKIKYHILCVPSNDLWGLVGIPIYENIFLPENVICLEYSDGAIEFGIIEDL